LHTTLGETILIQCDSAVVINQTRYRLYERARMAVLSYDPNFYEDIVSEFQQKGALMQTWADSLNKSYNRLSTSYGNTLSKTEKELNTMQTNIKIATTNLEEAKTKLDSALKNLNKARWEKWLWAAGGIVLGGAIVAAAN
jgi:seryl-tRNA synthetase